MGVAHAPRTKFDDGGGDGRFAARLEGPHRPPGIGARDRLSANAIGRPLDPPQHALSARGGGKIEVGRAHTDALGEWAGHGDGRKRQNGGKTESTENARHCFISLAHRVETAVRALGLG